MDMTSVWTAEHGWCYLNAIVDCCTREIPAFALDIRCRAEEALAVVEAAVERTGSRPGGSSSAPTTAPRSPRRGFRARLSELGITHRRGGYRDPESQAFIESWFGMLKQREVWRQDYETLEEARAAIGAYVERYHHRPTSVLGYRTPKEVRQTWEDARDAERLRNHAA